MTPAYQTYERMKAFVGFDDADAGRLRRLAPVFAKHGATITDGFYATLEQYPETAKLIAGRVDALKATHHRWMQELFSGSYEQEYFDNRMRIGVAHVRIGLDPMFVEGVMSYLRTAGLLAIREEFADAEEVSVLAGSYVKVLDLDLLVINLAYGDERLDRLTRFTGMSRKLLERCIVHG